MRIKAEPGIDAMHATRLFQAVDATRAIPDIVRKRAHARSRRVATALACWLLGACGASSSSSSNADGASQSPPDASQTVTQALSFETNDGVTLHATIRGTGDLRARPLIIEFSPYGAGRSEEHTSELQSLMRISYAVFCLKKNKQQNIHTTKT